MTARPPSSSATERARVADRDGLHARPCAAIARIARASRCRVRIACKGKDADGASVLELLTLAAPGGAELEIQVEGPDAARVAREIATAVRTADPG